MWRREWRITVTWDGDGDADADAYPDADVVEAKSLDRTGSEGGGKHIEGS